MTASQIFLDQLMAGFAEQTLGQNPLISGLSSDSRTVKPGDLFFALAGGSTHGNTFIEHAINAGAVAIAMDTSHGNELATELSHDGNVAVVLVENLNQKLGLIAARFFNEPSAQMQVVGITGTNGKTSCSHLLAQCLADEKSLCGVIGTMGAGVWGKLKNIQHTTPGAIELQAWLSSLLAQGAGFVSMEVSSHGLEQGRVNGCQFSVAIFTNLSRDHLDYHGDMTAYGESKLKLFAWPGLKNVVVNLDDPFSEQVLQTVANKNVQVLGVTLKNITTKHPIKTINAEIKSMHQHGTTLTLKSPWGDGELQSSLLGEFNASNLLSVLAALLLLDVPFKQACARVEKAQAPVGRLETFGGETQPLVVVDYAHTPDALEKVLQTLKKHSPGKLWVLFGCGGDRDKGKRPEMGRVAEQIADVVWLTNDNPRTEDSSVIIEDIFQGITNKESVVVEMDRARAIRNIVKAANQTDVVLIAGKGHEDYQIVGDQRLDFSDRLLVAEVLGEAA